MGKLTEFIIILNTQRVVFYPGEKISGQVVVDLLEPMNMRGIELKFEGKRLLKLGFNDKMTLIAGLRTGDVSAKYL